MVQFMAAVILFIAVMVHLEEATWVLIGHTETMKEVVVTLLPTEDTIAIADSMCLRSGNALK
jgi:hypothetical protein